MANGLAAGAQAGAAFGPWGAAIGGALGAASDLAQGGAGPSTMISGAPVDARSFMDGSGWTVSTGSSNATGGKSGGASMGTVGKDGQHALMGSMAGQDYTGLLMLGAAGVVLWLMIR